MNVKYIWQQQFRRSLAAVMIVSLFTLAVSAQKERPPTPARLIVTAEYVEESTINSSDSKGTSKLTISLSSTRGVQLSEIVNPGGDVDILDLPGSPMMMGGSINYTSELESGTGNNRIHATQSFAGTFVSDGSSNEAFWSDDGHGLIIRIKAHALLKGHCSQETKDSSGKTTTSDKCDGNLAVSAITGIDRFESNENTDRTPETRYKTNFDLQFDAVPPAETAQKEEPSLEYADTIWHGSQTEGDPKVGYKVEFDRTKQNTAGALSGKKHLHVSAQIVPGAPTRPAFGSQNKRPDGE